MADQILKTDVLGRAHSSLQRRERILDEFERSGGSGAEFARIVGVNYQTFATWVQARRKKRGDYPRTPARPKVPAARWIEAVADAPVPASAGSSLVIELPGGASMRVGDAAQAALASRVLKALQKDLPAC
jgi:transposase-like protein